MKRITLLILVVFLLLGGQVFAQDTGVITLNDSNPSISADITLPVDTTGVVTVNVSMAAVTLTDANGQTVFSSTDPRVHYLELSITPNTGVHTLTIQRLPGKALASARIGSQANLTVDSSAQTVLVDTQSENMPQRHTFQLDATHPADQVVLDIQPSTTGLITASFPGAVASSQLNDSSGMLIATSSRDIDGFNAILDGGRYTLGVQAVVATGSLVANVDVTSTDQFSLLDAPQIPVDATVVPQQTTTVCTATILSGSVNLRSGPGTGYSVLGFNTQGDILPVGGTNPEQNWLVVGTDSGSGWVSRDLTQLDGNCGQMQTFNIPLRNAQVAPVIVQTVPTNPSLSSSSGSNTFYGDDDHNENHGDGDHHSSDNGGSEDD